MTDQRLLNRVVLVTGASKGIGWYSSLALAKEGAHVIAVAQNEAALKDLETEIKAIGGSITLAPMDITDRTAVNALAADIKARWGKLDGFFANAGLLGSVGHLVDADPVDDWDRTMAVNLTANWYLTRQLHELLLASDAPRVLYMSSGAPHKCLANWGIYSISKAGLEALLRTYAAETKDTAMKANCFNPGATRTGMRAKAAPNEDPMTLPHPEDLVPFILDCLVPACNEHGRIYDFRARCWKDYGSPVIG